MAEHEEVGCWVEGAAGGRECSCGFSLEWSGEDPVGDAAVQRMFDEHLEQSAVAAEEEASAAEPVGSFLAQLLTWLETTAAAEERACTRHLVDDRKAATVSRLDRAKRAATRAVALREYAGAIRLMNDVYQTEEPPAAATAEGEH